MKNKLNVALVQSTLEWESPTANLTMFDNKLDRLSSDTDLIILPEMFSTGFSMNASAFAETMDGPSVDWMKQKARTLDAVIMGTLMIQEEGRFYNRLIWMFPEGNHLQYDKRHTFTLAKEHLTYTAGTEKLVFEWHGWKICPLVCYDLRFPVWSRNQEEYDLLIYTANWPEKRSYHWKQLLIARAIENQCHVLGVNVVGKDGNGLVYSGDSAWIDPLGNVKATVAHEEKIIRTTISIQEVSDIRTKLPFLKDRDDFRILKDDDTFPS